MLARSSSHSVDLSLSFFMSLPWQEAFSSAFAVALKRIMVGRLITRRIARYAFSIRQVLSLLSKLRRRVCG